MEMRLLNDFVVRSLWRYVAILPTSVAISTMVVEISLKGHGNFWESAHHRELTFCKVYWL